MSFIGRSRILRSDGVTPLTDDNIHLLAPSALAVGAHESRSARYTYIPTAEVTAGMRQHGFLPMAAAQARSRDAGRAGHTKHMLRFRHVDTKPVTERRVGATFPEIVLLNSHDGTSAYRIMSGMFRLICLNGMVVADRQGAEVRIPHMGDVVRQVIEGSYAVLDGARRALDAAAAWQGVPVPSPPPARRGPTPALLTDLPPAPNPRTASICHVQLFENSAVKAEPSWRMGNSTATATSSTPPPFTPLALVATRTSAHRIRTLPLVVISVWSLPQTHTARTVTAAPLPHLPERKPSSQTVLPITIPAFRLRPGGAAGSRIFIIAAARFRSRSCAPRSPLPARLCYPR